MPPPLFRQFEKTVCAAAVVVGANGIEVGIRQFSQSEGTTATDAPRIRLSGVAWGTTPVLRATPGGSADAILARSGSYTMSASSIPVQALRTGRLSLLPTDLGHADRIFEIQSDWDVARMLRTMSFPPSLSEVRAWCSDQIRQRAKGEAYRFSIIADGQMIGMVYLDAISGREANLGYWLDRSSWGKGYAFEAAKAVIGFAFSTIDLERLRAGHAQDNPASGKILIKLGFRPLDIVQRHSQSRGHLIMQHRYVLEVPSGG